MRNFLVLAVVLGILSIPMMAQDHSKVEVFGGYQFSHFGDDFSPVSSANGWDTSLTYKFNRMFGVTADFTGAYHTISAASFDTTADVPVRFYTYTFGPVATFNVKGKVKPFVHVLIGGAHLSASTTIDGAKQTATANGFTEMLGGGIDVKVNKHFALRLIQADWVYYHFNNSSIISDVSSGGNAKIATGIVVRF